MKSSVFVLQFALPKLKSNPKLERLNAPVGFWSMLENRSKWLQEIGKKLGVKKNEDWYKVSRSAVVADECN